MTTVTFLPVREIDSLIPLANKLGFTITTRRDELFSGWHVLIEGDVASRSVVVDDHMIAEGAGRVFLKKELLVALCELWMKENPK